MNRGSPSTATRPLARTRIAEQVFDSLVRAILIGELKPQTELATQESLAKQFGASTLLVRQAIHRLEDLGLVRVRQGSPTVVLDPNRSTDMRVLQHRIELAASDPKTMAAVLEVQILGALPLLVLAERTLTAPELEALMQLSEGVNENLSPAELHTFMVEYWRMVGEGTRNPYFQHQLRWWWMLADQLRERGGNVPRLALAGEVRRNYTELTRALAARTGSLHVYLKAIEPLLTWLDYARAPARVPSERPRKLAKTPQRKRAAKPRR